MSVFKASSKLLEKRELEIEQKRHQKILEQIKQGGHHSHSKSSVSDRVKGSQLKSESQQGDELRSVTAVENNNHTSDSVINHSSEAKSSLPSVLSHHQGSAILIRNKYQAHVAKEIAKQNERMSKKIKDIFSLQGEGSRLGANNIYSRRFQNSQISPNHQTPSAINVNNSQTEGETVIRKHTLERKRKNQEIEQANKVLNERLRSVKSVFDIKKWQNERQYVEHIMVLMSQFPQTNKVKSNHEQISVISNEEGSGFKKKKILLRKPCKLNKGETYFVEVKFEEDCFIVEAESINGKKYTYSIPASKGQELLQSEFNDDVKLLIDAIKIDEQQAKMIISVKKPLIKEVKEVPKKIVRPTKSMSTPALVRNVVDKKVLVEPHQRQQQKSPKKQIEQTKVKQQEAKKDEGKKQVQETNEAEEEVYDDDFQDQFDEPEKKQESKGTHLTLEDESKVVKDQKHVQEQKKEPVQSIAKLENESIEKSNQQPVKLKESKEQDNNSKKVSEDKKEPVQIKDTVEKKENKEEIEKKPKQDSNPIAAGTVKQVEQDNLSDLDDEPKKSPEKQKQPSQEEKSKKSVVERKDVQEETPAI